MKNILILGAGPCQINGIKKIKSLGYKAFVADYRLDSPGKVIGDISILADVFSFDAIYNSCKNMDIDGVFTTGTDQPVLTVSQVANALDLPCLISEETALKVTNKSFMKKCFTEHDIPTVKYLLLKENYQENLLDDFPFPAVMKPVDSQGQRGIYKVKTKKEVRELFGQVMKYSRADEILLETFYENKEVTVSGWVEDDTVHIFTITDRVTFPSDEHIGVCLSHEYPSIHLNQYRKDFFEMTCNICKAFEIHNGPIYFQYLVGSEGVKVNEIACRLGGAYEDVSIPWLTGVDVLKKVIDSALGFKTEKIKYQYEESKCVSTQLFFCRPGKITAMTPIEEILKIPFVLSAEYNYKIGDVILNTENASARAGHFIVYGENEEEIKNRIAFVYEAMKILSEDINLILKGKRYYR
ncbi:MAG: ATP-grasp domain-containing protein [Clostridia bacterium]|nr:ATP-grasp domain-containing protein [Clostridia bacterium]